MSNRPARVLANVAINMPRPRNVFEAFRNPDFDGAYDAVWSVFKSQVDMRGHEH
jgi:NitT/TauT family transport system ATP-binding protein